MDLLNVNDTPDCGGRDPKRACQIKNQSVKPAAKKNAVKIIIITAPKISEVLCVLNLILFRMFILKLHFIGLFFTHPVSVQFFKQFVIFFIHYKLSFLRYFLQRLYLLGSPFGLFARLKPLFCYILILAYDMPKVKG